MTTAYNELYLDDAMMNLGDMVDYGVRVCGYQPDDFFAMFITSGIASNFEIGNPKYVAGMSGIEMAQRVLQISNINTELPEHDYPSSRGREYWAGWILAYYQWITKKRFEDIVSDGLPLSDVLDMYILHEADESKFVDSANIIIERYKSSQKTKLQQIRKARGFTQQELSKESGVALRMIQLYEQRQNDINKAQVIVVVNLAKALGCEVEDLLE